MNVRPERLQSISTHRRIFLKVKLSFWINVHRIETPDINVLWSGRKERKYIILLLFCFLVFLNKSVLLLTVTYVCLYCPKLNGLKNTTSRIEQHQGFIPPLVIENKYSVKWCQGQIT